MRKQILNITVLLLTVIFAFQSCQKEIYDPGLSVDKNLPDIVQQAQVWVQAHSFRSKNATVDYSTLDFDWKSYGIKKNQQGQDVVSIPVANRYQEGKEYMEFSFVAKEKVGTLKHYTGDFASEFVQLNFYAIDGKLALSGSFSTKTGKMTTRIALSNKSGKLQKIASSSNNNNGAEGNNTDGFIIDEVPVPPPTQPTWPPVIPPPSGGGSTPPPSGGGGGSVPTPPGGGGGYNPPSGGNYQPTNKLTKTPSKDPCAGRAAVNERLNLSKIKSQNQLLFSRSTEFEHSYTINMNIKTKELSTTDIITGSEKELNGDRTEVRYNMSWSSSQSTPNPSSINSSVTVGFNHTHPFPSAPSPKDIFTGSTGFNQIQGVDAATTTQMKSTFLEYLTSSIVTPNHVYVITIKEPNNWFERSKTMDENHNIFNDLSLKYQRNGLSISQAQEKALLELYSDLINLYRADRSNTSSFQNLKLDASGNLIVNPC